MYPSERLFLGIIAVVVVSFVVFLIAIGIYTYHDYHIGDYVQYNDKVYRVVNHSNYFYLDNETGRYREAKRKHFLRYDILWLESIEDTTLPDITVCRDDVIDLETTNKAKALSSTRNVVNILKR